MTVFGLASDGDSTLTAQKLRHLLNAVLIDDGTNIGAHGGVRMSINVPNVLKVAAGVSGLTVTVQPGICVVPGLESTAQGPYVLINDAVKTVTLSTADGAQARIDRIVAKVVDNGDETSTFDIVPVAGTPAGSPAAPTPTGNYLKLARVTVPAAADGPEDLTIVDERRALGTTSRVWQPIPWVVTGVPTETTTSATFVDLAQSRINFQMMRMRLRLMVRSSASDTTGEVKILINGVQWRSTLTVTGSMFAYQEWGPAEIPAGYFGQIYDLSVQARRTAGTGTIGIRVIQCVIQPLNPDSTDVGL